jgi:hypothetical protein
MRGVCTAILAVCSSCGEEFTLAYHPLRQPLIHTIKRLSMDYGRCRCDSRGEKLHHS